MLTERYHPIIKAIRTMPKPVVAAVNGVAAGIGLSLALSCDLVVSAESAYFVLAFVNVGLVPDGGSSALVPSRIGFARAAELAMLGERLPATQALDWGLINRAWPDAELMAKAEELVGRLASGPTGSYAGTKRQLNAWLYRGSTSSLSSKRRSSGSGQRPPTSPRASPRSRRSGRLSSPVTDRARLTERAG